MHVSCLSAVFVLVTLVFADMPVADIDSDLHCACADLTRVEETRPFPPSPEGHCAFACDHDPALAAGIRDLSRRFGGRRAQWPQAHPGAPAARPDATGTEGGPAGPGPARPWARPTSAHGATPRHHGPGGPEPASNHATDLCHSSVPLLRQVPGS